MNIEQIKALRDEMKADYDEARKAEEWVERKLKELRSRGEHDEFYETYEKYYEGRASALFKAWFKVSDFIKDNS